MADKTDRARSSGGQHGTTNTTNGLADSGRRRFLAGGASAVALAGLAGCTGALGSVTDDAEEVTILLTPENPTDVRNDYMPMKNYLEGEIDGLEVTYEVPQDYSAIRPALRSEQAEMGMDDITLISDPDMMDVFGTAVTGGTAWYFSMMLTNPGSEVDERTDLEGKHVGFADKLSTSGSIFAVYTLMEAGLDVGDAPQGEPVDFEGTWSNHANAVDMLVNEEVDACCTWSGNGMQYVDSSSIPQEVRENDAFVDEAGTADTTLEPIWWSFPIPKQPIYARSSWESEMKGEIEQALLDSSEEKLSEYKPDDYDATMPFTTLEETSIDAYDPVIERLNALEIDLG